MIEIPEWGLGLAIGLAAVAIAALSYMATRQKDRDLKAAERSSTNAKIDMLMTKTDSMERSITAALGSIEGRHALVCDKVERHTERIAKVEESAKQAHKRLDEHLGGRKNDTE